MTTALIEARIRMESEARAVPLCTWPEANVPEHGARNPMGVRRG